MAPLSSPLLRYGVHYIKQKFETRQVSDYIHAPTPGILRHVQIRTRSVFSRETSLPTAPASRAATMAADDGTSCQ
eukprot:152151-Pleurochrysis_carterae.AAC.1